MTTMRHAILIGAFLLVATNALATRIVIQNGDKPGVGFNDPTPAAPVGGNAGVTLGQQRLNVFQAAGDFWEQQIDSRVDILVTATFSPIESAQDPCTATSGVLGQARPNNFVANFTGAPRAEVLYPIALANKMAGRDLSPSTPDIFVQFNSLVDNDVCLGDTGWYYGLDHQHGADWDLFVVVLHELAHGLGISGAATAPNFLTNRPAVFDTQTLDLTTGLRWDQMSLAHRSESLLNTGNVVWDGELTRAAAARWLQPVTTLAVTIPAPIAKNYDIGIASFGPSATRTTLNGNIVQANDAADEAGPATTDGCSTISDVAGKIALIDRGTCTFVEKARNAQRAGAIGVIIADNRRETCLPPDMGTGDADARDIAIPVISVRQDDGDAFRTQLTAGITAMLRTDASQRAGAASDGHLRLYTPCTADAGSSLHHADVTAFPNLLMEPDINPDLLGGVDLAVSLLYDIGWTPHPRTGRRFLKR
jgi:hypothetical protein